MVRTNDYEGVVKDLGIKIASVADNELTVHCPFHTDHHPSCCINAATGLWICFQCGESGSIEMLIERLGGSIDLKPYLREVRYQRLAEPVRVEEPPPSVTPVMLQAEYQSFRLPPPWALEERRITGVGVERFGLRWDGGWVFPIWSLEGALWGWQWKREHDVRNYPRGVHKGETLFGLRELETSSFAVVESPLDVVRLATAGVPAVATFGAYVSRHQVSLIIDKADRLILALDGDEEGQTQTARLYRRFARVMPTRILHYPPGAKDPGDLSDEQITDLFHAVL